MARRVYAGGLPSPRSSASSTSAPPLSRDGRFRSSGLPPPSLSPAPSLSRRGGRLRARSDAEQAGTSRQLRSAIQRHTRLSVVVFLLLLISSWLLLGGLQTRTNGGAISLDSEAARQKPPVAEQAYLSTADPGTDPYHKVHSITPAPASIVQELEPRPKPRAPSGDPDEKFLAYFPHSGYHNQRISLENALTLAKLLGRTLLVPPLWLGHSIPFISFDKMYDRLLQARKTGLERCKEPSSMAGPMPQECLGGYWDYTVVSWDFLVDLESLSQSQRLVDRWDMSYEWLEGALDIDRTKDIKYFKDAVLYEYRFYSSTNDSTPLDKFQHRLDVQDLIVQYSDYKVMHFGSLFGTTRLRLPKESDSYASRSLARRSMVFRNPFLDEVTDAIRDRLGGPTAYIGIHLRLGDGVFQSHAASNVKQIFTNLCRQRLGLADKYIQGLLRESAALRRQDAQGGVRVAQDILEAEDLAANGSQNPVEDELQTTVKDGRKPKGDPHDTLKPLPRISTRAESPLHSSLSCRGYLHTDANLVSLNTPVFLATDSKLPESDPNLAIFFDSFPCLFVLSDFESADPTAVNSEPLQQLRDLQGLTNKEDGVRLAPFLYPLVDAMVAAKGRYMLGTPGSTFSTFAVEVLHQVYHGWQIVERG